MESVERGWEEWTSAPVGTHQVQEYKTLPNILAPKGAKKVLCPKSFHPFLHRLSLNHQSHSSKTRPYYTYVIKILNRNKLPWLFSNSNLPNPIHAIQGTPNCATPNHDRNYNWMRGIHLWANSWGGVLVEVGINDIFRHCWTKDKKYLLSMQSMK